MNPLDAECGRAKLRASEKTAPKGPAEFLPAPALRRRDLRECFSGGPPDDGYEPARPDGEGHPRQSDLTLDPAVRNFRERVADRRRVSAT